MDTDVDLLVIGAGPTGLAAALLLADHGIRTHIIDKASEPSRHSKAFGVNARTLELLERSGVTDRFLENGRKMTRLNLRRGDTVLSELRFDEVKTAFPFMLVQSQADSERILEDALSQRGLTVERGAEARSIRVVDGLAVVEIESECGQQVISAKTVLGADGAGSIVRKTLQVSFDGVAYDEPWQLWDVRLDTSLAPDQAHVFLLDQGGMFVVRLHGDVWRVLGSGPDLLQSLPAGTTHGAVEWHSEFRISNRVAGCFSQGPVFLAGDAAHIHAGIGARGMNLGIEDAFVFAELYRKGELERYDALRRPVICRVVRDITRLMRVPRATTLPGRLVRAMPWVARVGVPAARSWVQPWILGLDHHVAT